MTSIENLSHEELCEVTISTIGRILSTDQLMSDLPGDIKLDEIQAQIAVVKGQYIKIQVIREAEAPLNVMIPQSGATVLDLKRAIKRNFELHQNRKKDTTKISWKYIWKTYWLQYNDRLLTKDKELLSNYEITNRSNIYFIKKNKKNKH